MSGYRSKYFLGATCALPISYFVSIAPKLNETLSSSEASGLPILPIKTFYDFLGKKNEKSIMLEDCTPNEIMEIIKGFENGKASDIPVSDFSWRNYLFSLYCEQNKMSRL